MERREWQRLRKLFHAALERPASERDVFIETICADEPELLKQLRRLLERASSDVKGPLDQPFFRLDGTPEEEVASATGTLLGGRYALERPLGSGGMGIVYLAQRADGEYTGQVAVKLLRPELATIDLERRLLAERQIMAALQHPNIARLLDGGTTDSGRPYLVMEYVEGEPIDRYCDRHRLSVENRLELFCKVCDAVHFAHQNLVVHRDLKPSNILITADGEPKLLDFGIAKLLPAGKSAAGITAAGITATAAGFAPMTLEHASPEQLRGESVTTAADVYALGILLYELLVGTRPFRLADSSLEELVRAVSEEPPLPPSSVVKAASAASSASVADAVRTHAAKIRGLQQRLAGDLDTIVLKCLHKAPPRRYRSADELSRDVDRHLKGLPVHARPDTLAYRVGKLVRRRPWSLAAAIAVVLGLLAFSTALFLEQRESHRQWRRAEAVVAFLKDTLRLPDAEFPSSDALFLSQIPDGVRGGQVPLREVLDQAAWELPGLDDDLVKADLAAILGEVYRRLGIYDAAEPLLEQALADRRRLRGESHEEVAHSLILCADLDVDQDQLEAAVKGYSEALAILKRLGGERDDLVYAALSGQGRVALQRNDLALAIEWHRRVLKLVEEVWGEDHPRFAESLLTIAEIRRQGDEADLASALAGRALDAFRRAYPQRSGHPRLAAALVSFGLLAERSGDYDGAALQLQQALAMRRELYGDDHPAVADSLYALAGVQRQRGELDAVAESCNEALRIHRAVYGAESSPVASSLNLKGLLLADRGDFVGAEDHHRQALDIWRQTVGGDHPLTASAYSNLGRALHGQLRFEVAQNFYDQALHIYSQAFGDEHFQVGRMLNNLGSLMLDWRWRKEGLARQAEEYLRRAEVIFEGEEDHPDLAALRVNLGLAVERQGRPSEAEELFRRAQEMLASRAEEEPDALVKAWLGLGRAMRDQGRYSDALEVAEEILEFLDPLKIETSDLRLRALGLLLDGLIGTASYPQAEDALQELLALCERLNTRAAKAKAMERAIQLYEAWGKLDQAEYYRQLSRRVQ